MGNSLVVTGGRNDTVGEMCPAQSYSTEAQDWTALPALPRFRHACWESDGSVVAFGGFENSAPDLLVSSLAKLNFKQISAPPSPQKPEEVKVPTKKLSATGPFKESSPRKQPAAEYSLSPLVAIAVSFNADLTPEQQRAVRLVPIDRLQEESKKLSPAFRAVPPIPQLDSAREELVNLFLNCLMRPKEWSMTPIEGNFMFKSDLVIELARECQEVLQSQPMVIRLRAPLKIFGDIHGQFQDLMRFFDLWRGPAEPGIGGDIDSFDYLFLGDYVDHGRRCLEVVCLLMALKVKYPDRVHLLRGHHEDITTNSVLGFADECAERLSEKPDSPGSAFRAMNSTFEWLPLAGLVEGRVLCLHGGIGSSLNKIEELKTISRPLTVVHEPKDAKQQLVLDVLWSDTTGNDEELGIKRDTVRDPNSSGSIYKFGPDRVERFLKTNGLDLLVRAHECVMDGIERFAKGQLITVFSATDYCGKHRNAGAMLVLQKNYEIVPKLIYPLDNVTQSNWLESAIGKPN